jgi:hypothetical protein
MYIAHANVSPAYCHYDDNAYYFNDNVHATIYHIDIDKARIARKGHNRKYWHQRIQHIVYNVPYY